MIVLFDNDENFRMKSLDKIIKESEIAVRQGATQLVLTDIAVSEEKMAIPMLFV